MTEREAAASTSLVGGDVDAAERATQNLAHAKKMDVFVVQLAMVDCITVAQTMKHSCACSIID